MKNSIKMVKIKIILLALAEVLFVFAVVFTLITPMPTVLLLIWAAGIIVDLIFLISSCIDMQQNNKELERKTYEDLYKAQKASYLVIRKNFDELQERMDRLEAKSEIPTDEIISAQKAVAKVTINRSKENADALLNSNDELINHIFGFEEKLDKNNREILDHQKELMEQTKEDLVAKNIELEKRFEELAASIEQMQQNPIVIPKDSEDEAEEEEIIETKEVEPAAVVDTSDTDRVMSPEEIEALFANL